MDRGIPCGSKICAKRAEQRRHEMHRERVRNVRPLIDTSEPQVAQMDHVRNNLKREQMLEERYSEIDRENRILLKKMSGIMKQQTPQTTPRQDDRRPPGPISLNRDARKKELLRITKENQSILKRIQQAQPVYNHVEWEGGHRRNLHYLKNCAEFPLVLRTPRSARGRVSSELVPLADETSRDSRPQSARSLPRNGGLQAHQEVGEPSVEESLKPVFKETRRFGDTYYVVEMAADEAGELHIVAHDPQSQVQLGLTLKDKVHRWHFRDTNGDYAQIAGRLAVVTDPSGARRLVLDEQAAAPRTPASAGNGNEEMDAEAMVVYRAKMGSAGSVNAEIDLGSSMGDARVRLRGLTPSTEGGPRR